MSDAAPSPSPPISRAGFWRRGFALFIDSCLIAFVLGLLGLVLFGPTGGFIRVSNMLIDSRNCSEVDPQRLELPRLPPFRITHAVRCTRSVLGYVHDRALTVAEVTRSGAVTYTQSLTFAVDAEGRPTRAFYLDPLILALLPAYILLLEWRYGRTLGKDLLGLRVRTLGGGALTFVQAAKRLLIRFLPEIVWIVPLLLAILGASAPGTGYFWGIWFVGAAAAIAILVNFAVNVRRGDLPWHDRWAGTEVVRDR